MKTVTESQVQALLDGLPSFRSRPMARGIMSTIVCYGRFINAIGPGAAGAALLNLGDRARTSAAERWRDAMLAAGTPLASINSRLSFLRAFVRCAQFAGLCTTDLRIRNIHQPMPPCQATARAGFAVACSLAQTLFGSGPPISS